jgi:hypothetical protein
MSRSNNVDQPNPAIRFFRWDGKNGGFNYWDKEKEETVKVPLPFRFMALDCLSTIKGYSDPDQSGYWSNEVRDIKKDTLTVRTKKGEFASGHYSEIKGRGGMKFCQSVYVAIRDGNKLAIANLQLTGAALSSWIEFRKKDKKIYDGMIEVAETAEGKKGAVTYQMPVFKKMVNVGTPEQQASANRQATALDIELQKYLSGYFKRTQDEVAAIHTTEAAPNEDDYSDIPPEEEFQEVDNSDLPF